MLGLIGLAFSALAAVVKFAWAHPIIFLGILSGLWVGYKYALRRYNQRCAIQKYRLEQRRRAGIPDSDKRPWIIARPAAELKRREEILAKQKQEREERERKEQADREREIHEWGSRAVHELRRMSRSDLDQLANQYQSPSGSRRRKPFDPPEVDEEPPMQKYPLSFRAPSRPASNSRKSSRNPSRAGSRNVSAKLAQKKRGRGDTSDDSEDEAPVQRRRKGKEAMLEEEDEEEDEEMDYIHELEDMDVDVIKHGLSEKRAAAKRSAADSAEPRKRRRKIFDLSDSEFHTDEEEGEEKMEEDEVSVKEERITPEPASASGSAEERKTGTPVQQLPVVDSKLHRVDGPEGLPIYGSVPGTLRGKVSTDASGVKWFEANSGELYRAEDLRISARKYNMPLDSAHPDTLEESGELIRVWVQEDEYDALKAAGRLGWQPDSPSQPRTAAVSPASVAPAPKPRHYGRIGMSRKVSVPPQLDKGKGLYAGANLGSPARKNRSTSSAIRFQPRQLSEAGRTKRHDELIAKLNRSVSAAVPKTPLSPVAGMGLAQSASKVEASSPLAKSSISAAGDKPAFSFGSASTSTTEKKEEPAKPAAGGFSFGAPKKDEEKKDDAPKPAAGGFSFGAPKKDEEKKEEPKAAADGFSFGAPKKDEEKKNEAPKPAASGFSFGAPAKKDDKPADKPASFSFGSSTPTPKTDEAPKPAAGGFSFGAPAKAEEKKDEAPKPASSFSFGSTAPAADKPADKPASSFSFGSSTPTPKADEPKPVGGFSFGAPAEKKEEPKPAGGFSFGAPAEKKDEVPKPASSFSFGSTTAAPAADKPATSSFGGFGAAPAAAAAAEKKDDKPASSFSFGSTAAKPASSGFGSFGAAADKKDEAPKSTSDFSFGSTSAPAADKPASSFGGFGSTTAAAEKKKGEAPKPASSFSFGSAPAAEKPASFGSFGATSAKPSGFGGFGSTPAPADKPADKPSSSFSFGSSAPAAAADKPASTFAFGSGDKPSFASAVKSDTSKPASTFSFGSTGGEKTDTPVFGSGFAPTANGGGSFAFGSNPASGATTPAAQPSSGSSFSFGAPSAAPTGDKPASTFSFGAPSGAGSNPAPAAGGFSFGSAPAAGTGGGFSFGAAPSSDNNAAGGFSFGAPAPGNTGDRPIRSLRRK